MILQGIPDLFGARTAISEWLSIIAAFFSVYAALTVGKIRGQMLGRMKLPNQISKLRKVAKNIPELMSNYATNTEAIDLELAKSESNLKTLLRTIRGQPRGTAQNLLKSVQSYRGNRKLDWLFSTEDKTDSDVWKMYSAMNVLIEELKDAVEEQRIGGQS